VRYALHPQVGIRPERFGALAYHYGNRRLTFLGDEKLLAVVQTADQYDDLESALTAAEIPPAQWPAYRRALDRLVAAEVVTCS
jgi:putative mycofactocin binding protein MftB